MKNKLLYTFEEDLAKRLKSPTFQRAWDESEAEYVLAKQMIKKRMMQNLSQRQLAKKAKTTQAVISRMETMRANPSLQLLKRIAEELNTKLTLRIS